MLALTNRGRILHKGLCKLVIMHMMAHNHMRKAQVRVLVARQATLLKNEMKYFRSLPAS